MKRIVSLLAALMLALGCATTAFAADGKVTYSGDAGKFIFAPGSKYSPTDLFPNFKDVMPGDTITQKITVKNDASNKVKIKVYMRALGAHPGSEEFLSKLNLLVMKDEASSMAYMFDAPADQTAQLTDWVLLGTLYSGGEIDLDVVLSVPPELDNKFKDLVGYLDWEFMIEEYPIEPTDPEPPKTGDDFNIPLVVGIMVLSCAMLIFLIVMRRKKREEA